MLKALLALAVAVSPLFAVLGCASSPSPSPTPVAAENCPGESADASAYRIGPGDVLQISVWKNATLERVTTVRPDGMVSFPLVDDVRAAGRTPMELQKVIAADLARYLTDPEVSVVVKEAHSFDVSVLGQVQHPGRYEVASDTTTVLDVIAQAGGLTNFADTGNIGVLRAVSGSTKRLPFRYRKAISANPGSADFCVRPGDIVVVR